MSFPGSSRVLCELGGCSVIARAVQVLLLWTELWMHSLGFRGLGKNSWGKEPVGRFFGFFCWKIMRFGMIKWLQGFKSSKTLILLYDYTWLGVKMGPFISTAGCLGNAWFMLWITYVFLPFWWSFADVPTLTSHFYQLCSFSPGGTANVISSPSLADLLPACSVI